MIRTLRKSISSRANIQAAVGRAKLLNPRATALPKGVYSPTQCTQTHTHTRVHIQLSEKYNPTWRDGGSAEKKKESGSVEGENERKA